jgi:hypothetical protein
MANRYEIKEVQTATLGFGMNGAGKRVKEALWIVYEVATGNQKFAPPQSKAFAQRLADLNNRRAA